MTNIGKISRVIWIADQSLDRRVMELGESEIPHKDLLWKDWCLGKKKFMRNLVAPLVDVCSVSLYSLYQDNGDTCSALRFYSITNWLAVYKDRRQIRVS